MTDGCFDAKDPKSTCVHCRNYGYHKSYQDNWICDTCWEAGKRGRFWKVIITGLHEYDYELIRTVYEYIAEKKSIDGSAHKLSFYRERSEAWVDDLKKNIEEQMKNE